MYCIRIRACEQAQTLSSDRPYNLIFCLLLIGFGLGLHTPTHAGAKHVENAPDSKEHLDYLFIYSFMYLLSIFLFVPP